jgi:hypothetical protein
MDQDVGQTNTPPSNAPNAHANTPRSNARRAERDGRTLETPERRRLPQEPPLNLPPQPFPLPPPAPPAGPHQFDDPFQNNYVGPSRYQHLPANLAQSIAQLPPLQPVRRRRGHLQLDRPPAGPSHTAADQQPVVRRGRPRQTEQNLNWMPMQPPNPIPAVSLY